MHRHSSLLWLLYELFGTVVNEGNWENVSALAFALLEPRIVRNRIHSASASGNKQVLLRHFLDTEFREQGGRNRKGKQPMQQFNERFKRFIKELEALQIIVNFDADANIFEQIYDGNKNTMNTDDSFNKQMIVAWREVGAKLALIGSNLRNNSKRNLNFRLNIMQFYLNFIELILALEVTELSHQLLSKFVQHLAEYWQSLEPILCVELQELTGNNELRLNFYVLEEWEAKFKLGLDFMQKLEEFCSSSSINVRTISKTSNFLRTRKNSIPKAIQRTPKQKAKIHFKPHNDKAIKRVWKAISVANATRNGKKHK